MEMYDIVECINKLRAKIDILPSGSVVSKKVKGKVYYYHRFTQNKKRIEKYVGFDKVEILKTQINERKVLEAKLKELETSFPDYKNNPQTVKRNIIQTSFDTNRKRGSDEIAKIIGDRVYLYRTKYKMTQNQLSQKYNISKNAVSNYERGVIVPPLDIIFDICNGLNLSLDEFFGFKEPKTRMLEEQEFVDILNSTTPEGKKTILEVARCIAGSFPIEE